MSIINNIDAVDFILFQKYVHVQIHNYVQVARTPRFENRLVAAARDLGCLSEPTELLFKYMKYTNDNTNNNKQLPIKI